MRYSLAPHLAPSLAGHTPKSESCISDEVKNLFARDDKLLVITGPYGSGKTHLLKYLHLSGTLGTPSLVKYYLAKQLGRLLEKFPSEKDWHATPEQASVIIIDNLDEVLIDDHRQENVTAQILAFVAYASKAGIKVLIGIRIGENPVSGQIHQKLMEMAWNVEIFRFPIIRLLRFSRPCVIEWLKRYGAFTHSNLPLLDISTIKNLHKRLVDATNTPLFLYMLANSYYERGINGIDDISLLSG